MAAIAAKVASRIVFLGPQAIRNLLGRGDVKALLAAVSVGELVDFFQGEQDKTLSAKIPNFGIVDLHRDKIIMPLSKKWTFRLLTRPRMHRHRTKTILIQPGARQDIDVQNARIVR